MSTAVHFLYDMSGNITGVIEDIGDSNAIRDDMSIDFGVYESTAILPSYYDLNSDVVNEQANEHGRY